jgi:hypothetical protein
MMGDRADVIFARADEIAQFVRQDCATAPAGK